MYRYIKRLKVVTEKFRVSLGRVTFQGITFFKKNFIVLMETFGEKPMTIRKKNDSSRNALLQLTMAKIFPEEGSMRKTGSSSIHLFAAMPYSRREFSVAGSSRSVAWTIMTKTPSEAGIVSCLSSISDSLLRSSSLRQTFLEETFPSCLSRRLNLIYRRLSYFLLIENSGVYNSLTFLPC